MEERNVFRTRFDIFGKFNDDEADDIAIKLGVNSYNCWNLGALYSDYDGEYEELQLSICECYECDVSAEELIKRTVAPLLDKVDVLKKLAEELGLKYNLQILADIRNGEELPPVTPPEEVVKFCRAIGAGISMRAGRV